MKILIIILAIIFINGLNYFNYIIGDKHYKTREEDKKRPKLYDSMFELLPKLNSSNFLIFFNYLFIVLISLPFIIGFFNKNNILEPIKDIIGYFIVLLLFRSFTINLTILPHQKQCLIKEYGWKQMVFGHCYDKLFSGHTSFILITMYVLYKYNLISFQYGLTSVFITIIYLIGARKHYTNDIILALLMCYLVIKEDLNINKLF